MLFLGHAQNAGHKGIVIWPNNRPGSENDSSDAHGLHVHEIIFDDQFASSVIGCLSFWKGVVLGNIITTFACMVDTGRGNKNQLFDVVVSAGSNDIAGADDIRVVKITIPPPRTAFSGTMNHAVSGGKGL